MWVSFKIQQLLFEFLCLFFHYPEMSFLSETAEWFDTTKQIALLPLPIRLTSHVQVRTAALSTVCFINQSIHASPQQQTQLNGACYF